MRSDIPIMITKGMKILRILAYVGMFFSLLITSELNVVSAILKGKVIGTEFIMLFGVILTLPCFVFMKKRFAKLLYYGTHMLYVIMILPLWYKIKGILFGIELDVVFVFCALISTAIFAISLYEYLNPDFQLAPKYAKYLKMGIIIGSILLFVFSNLIPFALINGIWYLVLKAIFKKRENDILLDMSLFISLNSLSLYMITLFGVCVGEINDFWDIISFFGMFANIILLITSMLTQLILVYSVLRLKLPKKTTYIHTEYTVKSNVENISK